MNYMPQYPIPQFIEEEGKIIFFLTFRQFFILVGAGAICFGLLFILPMIIAIIASMFVLGIFGIIAFLKIDGMSVVKVLLNMMGFYTKTKVYTWKKDK